MATEQVHKRAASSRYTLLASFVVFGAGGFSFMHAAWGGWPVPKDEPRPRAKVERPNVIGKRIELSRLRIAPQDRGFLLLVMPGCGSCQWSPLELAPAWFKGKPDLFAVFPDDIRQVSNSYLSSIPQDRLVTDPEFRMLPSALFSFAPLVLKLDRAGTVIAVSPEGEAPATYISKAQQPSGGDRY